MRVDHVFRRPAQPDRSFIIIALNAQAFSKADAVIIRGNRVAAHRRLFEPLAGADRILGGGIALHHQSGQVVLGLFLACLGRAAQPDRRLGRVAMHPGAGQIQQAQRAGRRLVAAFRRTAIPHGRFGIVGGQIATAGVKIAHHCRGIRIALQCGAPQPGFAIDQICRHRTALHQGDTVAGLRGPQAELGGVPEITHRLGAVLRHAVAVIRQHADQIERGGQLGLRRPHQQRSGGAIFLRPLGLAHQRQRVAQASLRAIGLGRQTVEPLGLVKVAQVLRPGGEHESQQRLPVGGALFGGFARPQHGFFKIGLRALYRREQGRSRAPAHQRRGLTRRTRRPGQRTGQSRDAANI